MEAKAIPGPIIFLTFIALFFRQIPSRPHCYMEPRPPGAVNSKLAPNPVSSSLLLLATGSWLLATRSPRLRLHKRNLSPLSDPFNRHLIRIASQNLHLVRQPLIL